MKKYDYYLHRSGGRAFDYFGFIGTPFQVSMIRWYIFKLFGYRATRVPRGSSVRRVMVRATIAKGAHRHSIAMSDAKQYLALPC